MTVATTDVSFSFAGNGTTTAFAFPRVLSASSDLIVVLRPATGPDVPQVLGTHFSVTLSAVVGGLHSAATVHFVTPPASGTTVIIRRDPSALQNVDVTSLGTLPLEVVEQALDRLTLMVQARAAEFGLSVRALPGENMAALPRASERAGKALAFDASGNPIAAAASTSTPATTFGAGLIATTAAPAAQGYLDGVLTVADLTALRALNIAAASAPDAVHVVSRRQTFVRQASDLKSLDDGANVIVDLTGNRWRACADTQDLTSGLAQANPYPARSVVGWWAIESLRVSQSVTPGFERSSDGAAGFTEAYYREFLTWLFRDLDARGVLLFYPEYLALTFTDFSGLTLPAHYDTTAAYQGYYAGLGGPANTDDFDWYKVTLEVAEAWGKSVMVGLGRGGDTNLHNDAYWLNVGQTPTANLTFGATTGTGVSCTASAATFLASDVGKIIAETGGTGRARITAYASASSVTVSVLNTLAGTSLLSQTWALRKTDFGVGGPLAVTLSATTGAAVTITSSPLTAGFFEAGHLGKEFKAGAGVGKITSISGAGDTATMSVSAAFAGTALAAGGWTLGLSHTTRRTQNADFLRKQAANLWSRFGTSPAFAGWYIGHETDHMAASQPLYAEITTAGGDTPPLQSYGKPILISGAGPIDIPALTATTAQVDAYATALLATGATIWAPQTSSLYGFNYSTLNYDWTTAAGSGVADNLSQLVAHFEVQRRAIDRARAWSASEARAPRMWGVVEPMSMDGPVFGNEYPSVWATNTALQLNRVATYADEIMSGQALAAISNASHSFRPKQAASGLSDFRTRAEAQGTAYATFVADQRRKWKETRRPVLLARGALSGTASSAAASATTDYALGTLRPLHISSEIWVSAQIRCHCTTSGSTATLTAQLRANGTLVGPQLIVPMISAQFGPVLDLRWKLRPEGVAQALECRLILGATGRALTIGGADLWWEELLP